MANIEIDPKTGSPIVKPVTSTAPIVLPPNKTPAPITPLPHSEPPPVHSPVVNQEMSDRAVDKLVDFLVQKPDPSLTDIDNLEKELESDALASEEIGKLAEMKQANKPVIGKQPGIASSHLVTPSFKSLGDEKIPQKLEQIRTLFRNCGMDSMQQQRTYEELIKILEWR